MSGLYLSAYWVIVDSGYGLHQTNTRTSADLLPTVTVWKYFEESEILS